MTEEFEHVIEKVEKVDEVYIEKNDKFDPDFVRWVRTCFKIMSRNCSFLLNDHVY